MSPFYTEVIQNRKKDQISGISYRTIEYFTELFSNFAKYG